jgi:hypothetical protein
MAKIVHFQKVLLRNHPHQDRKFQCPAYYGLIRKLPLSFLNSYNQTCGPSVTY